MPKAKRINTTPADAIFTAIATHKRLEREWLDMAAALDGSAETGRRSKAYAEARGITETDVETASDHALAASWKMARTEPMTTASAAAMLHFLTKDDMYG
jgi:hypothetical protein